MPSSFGEIHKLGDHFTTSTTLRRSAAKINLSSAYHFVYNVLCKVCGPQGWEFDLK